MLVRRVRLLPSESITYISALPSLLDRRAAMKLKNRYKWLLLSILIVPSILGLTVLSYPTVQSWFSLSSGGGNMASGSHQVMASFGQGQPVGVSSSQSFGVEAGFWPGAGAPTPTPTPTPSKWDLNGDGVVDGD